VIALLTAQLSDRAALGIKWGELNKEGLQYAKGKRVYGGWGRRSDHPACPGLPRAKARARLPEAWL